MAEMAVMLFNYANFKGYDIPVNRAMPSFADQADISEWALAAVGALAQAGVLSGSDNRFSPLDNATRAEAAQIFRNFLRFVVEGSESGTVYADLPTETLNSTADAYIDRRAQEAVEAALMPAKGGGDDDDDDLPWL